MSRQPENDIRARHHHHLRSNGPVDDSASTAILQTVQELRNPGISSRKPGMAVSYHKAITPFSGESKSQEEADLFIDQFSNYVTFAGTDKAVQPNLFMMCLKPGSTASQWFQELSQPDRADIDKVFNKFMPRDRMTLSKITVAGAATGYKQIDCRVYKQNSQCPKCKKLGHLPRVCRQTRP